jgi:hypothetical protein
MGKGMLDDIPIINPARDKAWEKLTKSKRAQRFFRDLHGEPFKFPLRRDLYEMFCIAWSAGWDDGFNCGWEKNT